MVEQRVNGDGGKYIDRIDPDDPDYIKEMRRPAEVKEDVRGMEARQRVSHILKSQAFKEELEEIVADQIRAGPHPASLIALQQISELIMPHSRTTAAANFTSPAGTVIPIADIRGVDSLNYNKGEKLMRCKVASTYRLVDLFGYAKGVNNIVTLRMNQDFEHFLVAPYGMLSHEITASSLLKVDMQGDVLDPGSTCLTVNQPLFKTHSVVHAARPDIKSIISIRDPRVVAISALKSGLLPVSQQAILIGEISYFDFGGVIADQSESDRMVRALGPHNKVMFLRNYGVLVGGETIEEVFHNVCNVMSACETQLTLLPAGIENLALPSDEVKRKVVENAYLEVARVGADGDQKKKWRKGQMEFEALMRYLDGVGYRTGFIYSEPLNRNDRKLQRSNTDIEVPPSSSSFGTMFDGDKLNSPLKNHMDKQKKHFKSEWLNTPNAYKKEDGDVSKWVPEDHPTAAFKVESPNQFAPQGLNPKELKLKHKEIRKDYYTEKVTAGPQSKILEGVTWEEAEKMNDQNGDQVVVMGAASKGIIQRDYQQNAGVYKSSYASNPFDRMTPAEIEEYKKEVERRGGDISDLEPGPDGQLISTAQRLDQLRMEQSPSHNQGARYVQETSIDDVYDGPSTSTPAHPSNQRIIAGSFQRSQSARFGPTPTTLKIINESLPGTFERTKSDRGTKSSLKSMDHGGLSPPPLSSGEGTLDRDSSRDDLSGDKKKKKKFRMPSFSKKNKNEK